VDKISSSKCGDSGHRIGYKPWILGERRRLDSSVVTLPRDNDEKHAGVTK